MTASAEQAARLAATQAGVEVREVDDVGQMELVDRLFSVTWGDEQDAVSVNMMKALSHAGHYVAGAWRAGELVGAAVGFGWGPGRPPGLHSHVAGVAPGAQGGGVGFALKMHQAAWSLSRGIGQVSWTFDPLVRRNGWFNLMKLGAVATSYHPDFYGAMRDGINSGARSDRCIVLWQLSAGIPGPRPESVPADAEVLLSEGSEGRPEINDGAGPGSGPLLCQVPRDALAIRKSDPALALEWRLALRKTMGQAMSEGYMATGMTRAGYYVLERKTP